MFSVISDKRGLNYYCLCCFTKEFKLWEKFLSIHSMLLKNLITRLTFNRPFFDIYGKSSATLIQSLKMKEAHSCHDEKMNII